MGTFGIIRGYLSLIGTHSEIFGVISVSFGLIWGLWGHSGSYQVHLGSFGIIQGHVSSIWLHLWSLGDVSVSFGPVWVQLGTFGII